MILTDYGFSFVAENFRAGFDSLLSAAGNYKILFVPSEIAFCFHIVLEPAAKLGITFGNGVLQCGYRLFGQYLIAYTAYLFHRKGFGRRISRRKADHFGIGGGFKYLPYG